MKNPFDPEENLDYAARTLKRYSEQFGSYGAALAAWHSGEGRVSKNIKAGGDGIPNTRDIDTGLSTRDYVANILAGVEDLDSVFSTPTAATTPNSLQDRPFDRRSLGILGLGFVFLGALVVAFRR